MSERKPVVDDYVSHIYMTLVTTKVACYDVQMKEMMFSEIGLDPLSLLELVVSILKSLFAVLILEALR